MSLVALDATAQDAPVWLERMSRAVEELNYEGTFIHVIGRRAEMLHIVHRNDNGDVAERIHAVDGVGPEIVRQHDRVQCILPDRRVVLLEQTREANPLVATLPVYSPALEANYAVMSYRTGQIAARATQVIGIRPKDTFRFGYVLWLDQETALPLKSQVRDENGDVVEQILFTEFAILDDIPDSALASTINTEGFTWFRPPAQITDAPDYSAWHATVPQGFELSAAARRRISGSEYPVEHLVYTDGLATVSVFIEDPNTETEVGEGYIRLGSTNAYSLTIDGRKVTAMGEVPRQTVELIATSIEER
ncbi:MAG TPA: MucB/RseB C-terminal domain-containing protein [Gammaproteobacteria bacterium]